jgi:hypothetical protein
MLQRTNVLEVLSHVAENARYAVLFGQNPDFSDGSEPGKTSLQQDNYFTKRILALLKTEQFVKGRSVLVMGYQYVKFSSLANLTL